MAEIDISIELLYALGGLAKLDDQLIFLRFQGFDYTTIYCLWSEIVKTPRDYVEKNFPRRELKTIVYYQHEGEDCQAVLAWSFHHTKRQARNFIDRQEGFAEKTFIGL